MERSPRTDRRRALALLLLVALGASAAPRLSFSRHGEPVAVRDLDALREAVEPAVVRVFEPYEGREVPFRALPFAGVLDAVHGADWRREEELLLRCRDGYQPTIPVRRVLEHDAWLAFAREDQERFAIRKRESGEVKTIELAPFYLVWENLDDETLRQEADYGWPYQLEEVDLIRTRDRFGEMTPPAGAPSEVLAGFEAFRVHCSKCHRLRGVGGEIGPELDPDAIAARDPQWLRAWIADPARIAPNARMPALNPDLPHRDRTIDRLVAYLESLAGS